MFYLQHKVGSCLSIPVGLKNKGEHMYVKVYGLVLSGLLLSGCMGPIKIPQDDKGGYANHSFSGHAMPEKARPNDATISLVEARKLAWKRQLEGRKKIVYIDPANNHETIPTTNIDTNKYLDQEFNDGYLLSFLYFDNGSIKHNRVPETGRLSSDITDDTFMWSYSSGKGITSYLVGHAICAGYISSIYDPIEWPMMERTVYGNQILKDLLDMHARDRHVVNDSFVLAMGGTNHRDVSFDAVAYHLRGTSPKGKSEHFYNNVVQDVVANYLAYKIGDGYFDFVRNVFQNHVKIENQMFVHLRRKTRLPQDFEYSGTSLQTKIAGDFYFTRKDFLRVGIAMMRDYQEDNCVGRYLKTIQSEARRNTRYNPADDRAQTEQRYWAKKYGGMLYFDFGGMRDRNVFGIEGRLGNGLMVDVDNSVVIAAHPAAKAVDIKFFMINAIRDGGLPE